MTRIRDRWYATGTQPRAETLLWRRSLTVYACALGLILICAVVA